MPLFYFAINDRPINDEDEGIDIIDDDAAIRDAIRTLSDIAADEITPTSDRQNLTVSVRDQDKKPIYVALLSFCGTKL